MSLPPEETAPSGSSLCLCCGLCFLGGLYGEASLTESEVSAAREHGLEVYWNGDKPVFRLPCPHYRENSCSRYHGWRPKVCPSYRCSLLTRYLRQEVSLAETRHIVARAKQLLMALEPEGGAPQDHDLWSRLGRWMETSGVLDAMETRRDNGPFLLKMAAAKLFLNRHFHTATGQLPEAAPRTS